MKRNEGLVLITGASEGIGRATAALFAAQGFDLLLLARGKERLQELCASLASEFHVACTPLPADVADAEEAMRRIRAALAGRRLAVAVINAGIGLYGPYVDTDWTDIVSVLRTNFEGALASARAVLPTLREQGHGSLVLVSSTIGKRAIPYNAAYCATKQGMLGFADALRIELKPFGIHVGVVCPARTDTPFFDRMTYAVPQTARRSVPTNPPELVAKAILRCVRLRRREVVVSIPGKLFAFVGYHFPRLSDFLLYYNVPRPDKP
ncbi:MAG: SDR family NAD(P)-dependent oxidoreductase [Bacteroidetes bacterium]|nr:SDR family NAD(P)-dependent oxidoreductase [Bacteroidota bacterium]